jgi:hypothetical protein
MDLLPGDIISDPIAFTGLWRLPFSRRLLQLAQAGGLMVDVGANLGDFSLLWAGTNPGNRGVAIEASPRNLDMLRRNIARNHFGERISVIPCAAGRAAGLLAGPARADHLLRGVELVRGRWRPDGPGDDAVDPAEIALLKI